MIILKMRASFGKLNGELCLHEGMNLLCLPNEAGKSTWSAFILAMLYGLSREQAKKANAGLPEKDRYKPWDGRSMEGAIDLIWNGRKITIERQTQGRIPMGVFRAYETESGTPIPELTADNCGQMLCGVERSVFERTAFIRQLGLQISEDSALEKRLSALVTTGEEGKSASELLQQLHTMDVKLSRPSTGRISRLSTSIEQAVAEQNKLYAMQNEALELRSQIEEARQELERCNTQISRIAQAKNAKNHLALEELKQKNAAQELLCRRLQEQVACLPNEAQLHSLQAELDRATAAAQTAKMEAAFAPAAPQKPTPPPCFAGLSLQGAQEKSANDTAEYQRLTSAKAPKIAMLLLSALVCILGSVLCFMWPVVGLALAAVGIVALICSLVVYLRKKSTQTQNRQQAQLLLIRYGIDDISALKTLLAQYETDMTSFAHSTALHEKECERRAQQCEQAEAALQTVVCKIAAFAPSCQNAAQCKEAISAALTLQMQAVSEQRALDLQRTQLSSMRQLFGETSARPYDAEALLLDEAKIIYERNAAAEKLSRLQEKLAEQNGKISASGDAAVLQSQIEQMQLQLADAQRTKAAVDLAYAAIEKADAALRSRFSPQITAEAGSILSCLTDGKYPKLLLQPDMSLSVREESGIVTHSAAAMSCGTADQMYLALRLAMCRRLLPQNAPIILDDALVNFDDKRTTAALQLLSEEAVNRQIILFSCKELP